MIDNLILLMIVSSIPLQTKPRCVWEDTAITPIIRTSYNWITWWLEVRKQYVKTLVKAVCSVYQVHLWHESFEVVSWRAFFSLINAIFCCLYFGGLQIWLTERTCYYYNFVAIILYIQENEIFLKTFKV